MKQVLPLLLAFLIPVTTDARRTRAWSCAELRDESDLIVIAIPVEVKETAERAPLPNILQASEGGKERDVIGAGIETTFQVLAVLKGDVALKTFVFHHYHEAEPQMISINGPGLVSFDPQAKNCYLMFLRREANGNFCAVSGQTDPDRSVWRIEGGHP